MRYVSTRGQAPAIGFLDAILAGLAPDGGLYVPESWPQALDRDAFRKSAATSGFEYIALNVLKLFAGDELEWDEAAMLASAAYLGVKDFEAPDVAPWPPAVTPLVQMGPGEWLLELFHGPSLAFKDVAMQLLGPLYDFALEKRDQRLTVVCATSGDTGGAAVEALKNRDRMDLFVLTPKGRVSDVQRRFMTTSGASNVYAIEIDGDFDACQALVKSLFADNEFSTRARLSGVNSINWARILAQSIYYHLAANALSAAGPVNFAVPSGNFGDAYAGFVAKKMGAPIGKILAATNSNDILHRTFAQGRYERAAQSQATLSPAMDISVASNFERLVFETTGRDSEQTARLYQQFAQSGGFDIPEDALTQMREVFHSAAVSDEETKLAMRNSAGFREDDVLCPHTAVAWYGRAKCMDADQPQAGPWVILATAHPAKFPDTVRAATGITPRLPAKCADLFRREEKIDAMGNDLEALKAFISARSRAWR